MKKIGELKKLLGVCAEDSSLKERARSRCIYENRKFSEGKSNWEKVTNDDIKDGTFVIPDGVTKIGVRAFHDCTSLKNIIIPESVAEIGSMAFYGCCSLKNIILPEGVTEIGRYAFAFCTSLTNITIPKSVTEIGDYAFYRCRSLKKVFLPKKVKLGHGVFHGCHPDIEIVYRD